MSEAVCPDDGSQMEHVVGSYETRLPNEERVHLENVRGVRCPECGETWYPGEEIRIEALKEWSHLNKIYEAEVPILMFLSAPAPSEDEIGYVRGRTIFHKMLFYGWEALDFPTEIFERFNPAPNGPMYHDFDEYEWHLQLVELLEHHEGEPPYTSHEYYATDEGKELGKQLLEIAPRSWRKVVEETKSDLLYRNASEVAEEAHEEYPDWQSD